MPQLIDGGPCFRIEAAEPQAGVRVRMLHHERNLRPGETISGAAMMTLCDVAMYAVLLGAMGEGAQDAVTTALNIDFLRRPAPGDLIAEVRLIKHGRRLAVGEIAIRSPGDEALLARASCTYFVGAG